MQVELNTPDPCILYPRRAGPFGLPVFLLGTLASNAQRTADLASELQEDRRSKKTSRKIGEVPIEYRPRIGEPKLGKGHGFRIVLDAVCLALRYNPVFSSSPRARPKSPTW